MIPCAECQHSYEDHDFPVCWGHDCECSRFMPRPKLANVFTALMGSATVAFIIILVATHSL